MTETAHGPDDLPTDVLPTDPEALRAFIREVIAERDAAVARCARLEHLLSVARNAQYGRSSEKLGADQLQFALEDVEQAVAAVEAEEDRSNPTKSRERAASRRTNRGALPEHLPRIVETIAPDDIACPCCRAPMHEIGADESQRLDIVPAQYRVIVTRRPKLIYRACAGTVVQAAAPERLIKGGLPTERLVAHVLAAKYAWHLPLYRQSQMMETQGLAIDRSTLAFSDQKGLGIRFRAIVPLQMVGGTGVGDAGANAYARAMSIEPAEFLKRFGVPMLPREFGEKVVSVLDDPQYAEGLAFGLKGDTGITMLEGATA